MGECVTDMTAAWSLIKSAVSDPNMTLSSVGMLSYITYLADNGVHPSVKTLCSATGASKPTVIRLIRELENGGYVVTTGNTRNYECIPADGLVKNFLVKDFYRKGKKESNKERKTKDISSSISNNLNNNLNMFLDYDIKNPIELKDYSNTVSLPEDIVSELTAPVESRRPPTCKDIVGYLNEKTGKHFQYRCADTRSHINARIAEGFTPEDFRKVIDHKVREWKGTSMEKYLRPETLFSRKFDRYLNEIGGDDGLSEVFGA